MHPELQNIYFHVSEIFKDDKDFPLPLKQLLEDPSVKKIVNRIHTDVTHLKAWDVVLAPTVELGHLANARTLTPTKRPALDFIVQKLWPGVLVEGKDGTGPRCSDWRAPKLSDLQIQYATDDGYMTAAAYNRIVQFMDPRVEGIVRTDKVSNGLAISVYSQGWKSCVTEGNICGYDRKNKL